MSVTNLDISEATWKEWERKRRNTLIGFVIVGTVAGIDYSIILPTAFLYLRDLVKSDRPELYYGIIFAVFCLSSSIFGSISGRWLDKTRKVRVYVKIVLVLPILGFMFYIIPLHPAFLIIGRFVCGIGDPFVHVITGEVFRIYNTDGSTRAMLCLASTYSVGFVIGPCISLIFKDVQFRIGGMEVNYLNFTGIFMICLLTIVLVVSIFLIHDCSAQVNLKEYLKLKETGNNKGRVESVTSVIDDINRPTDNENTNLITKSDNESSVPVIKVLKKILTKLDIVLMYVTTFIFMYAVFATDLLLPLIIYIILNWSLTTLTILILVHGVVYFVLLLLLIKYGNTRKVVYYASITFICCEMFQFCVLISIKLLSRDSMRDSFFMVLFMLFWICGWCFEDVFIKILLSKMVPSEIQSFTQSLRNVAGKFAMIVAALTAPIIFPWMHWWALGLLISVVIILVAFIVRRGDIIDPEEMDVN